MDVDPTLPSEVLEAVNFINATQDKEKLTRQDRDNLNRARLRVAYYACRSENIMATKENLSYVLGSDAAEIMTSYDKFLENEETRAREIRAREAARKRGQQPGFWEGAS